MNKNTMYFYVITNKIPAIIIGKIKGNIIYAYHGRYPNFGDQLTPVLLKYYGFTPVHAYYKPTYLKFAKAEFLSVGTLLQNTPSDFTGIILGTGGDNIKMSFNNAKIIGVRGRLTQNNVGMENESITLGDPGLLVSYIFPEKVKKKWKLGVVPHFVDKSDEIIHNWKKCFGDEVKIIDVQRKPKTVIRDIKRCNNIISSSLHGLVTADSFGIPNVMFAIRRNMPKKHDHKYKDYYSALGIDLKIIEVNGNESIEYIISNVSCKKELVEPIKNNLHNVFSSLRDYL